MYPSVADKLLSTQIIIAFLFLCFCCYAATQVPLAELTVQVHQERSRFYFFAFAVMPPHSYHLLS